MSKNKRTADRKKKLNHFKLMEQHKKKKLKEENLAKLKEMIQASIKAPEEEIVDATEAGVSVDDIDVGMDFEIPTEEPVVVDTEVEVVPVDDETPQETTNF
jgi:hypothetical protein